MHNKSLFKIIIILISVSIFLVPASAVYAAINDIDLDGYSDTGPWDCTRDNSCPDSDHDGVIDPLDFCDDIAAPHGIFGCPDNDRDGVYDYYTVFHVGGFNGSNRTETIYVDQCPDEPGSGLSVLPYLLDQIPEVARGTNGCPGKCNSVHYYDLNPESHPFFECPQNEEGQFVCWQRWPELGWANNYHGIPSDWDCDGVPDNDDECRQLPGPYYNQGCPRRLLDAVHTADNPRIESGDFRNHREGRRAYMESRTQDEDNYIGEGGDWECVGEECRGYEEEASPPRTPIPTEPEISSEIEDEIVVEEPQEIEARIDVPFYSNEEATENGAENEIEIDTKQNLAAQSYAGCSLISKNTCNRSAVIFILTILLALLPITVSRFSRILKTKTIIYLAIAFLISASLTFNISNANADYDCNRLPPDGIDVDHDGYAETGYAEWCAQCYCNDHDEDGVSEPEDYCDYEPVPDGEGVHGCPDTDRDGVIDYYTIMPWVGLGQEEPDHPNKIIVDKCPNEPGVGITPRLDILQDLDPELAAINGCPSEEGASNQWVNEVAREMGQSDTDFDGVLDNDDNCRREPGSYYNNGCPERNTSRRPAISNLRLVSIVHRQPPEVYIVRQIPDFSDINLDNNDDSDDETGSRTPIPTHPDDEDMDNEDVDDEEVEPEQTLPQVDYYRFNDAQADETDQNTTSLIPETGNQGLQTYAGCSLISKGNEARSFTVILLPIILSALPVIRARKLNKRLN
ncbi:MAG: hypothetical protein ABH859_07280 [Pseudomonadota bacterium]